MTTYVQTNKELSIVLARLATPLIRIAQLVQVIAYFYYYYYLIVNCVIATPVSTEAPGTEAEGNDLQGLIVSNAITISLVRVSLYIVARCC